MRYFLVKGRRIENRCSRPFSIQYTYVQCIVCVYTYVCTCVGRTRYARACVASVLCAGQSGLLGSLATSRSSALLRHSLSILFYTYIGALSFSLSYSPGRRASASHFDSHTVSRFSQRKHTVLSILFLTLSQRFSALLIIVGHHRRFYIYVYSEIDTYYIRAYIHIYVYISLSPPRHFSFCSTIFIHLFFLPLLSPPLVSLHFLLYVCYERALDHRPFFESRDTITF